MQHQPIERMIKKNRMAYTRSTELIQQSTVLFEITYKILYRSKVTEMMLNEIAKWQGPSNEVFSAGCGCFCLNSI